MPYSEKLADRIRIALMDLPHVEEKKMFSGMAFLVNDKMCINVTRGGIMCRVDPELQDQLLEEKPCRTMVMKGKEYKGYILVNEEDLSRKAELDFWVGLCLDFNGRAKKSGAAVRRAAKGMARKGEAPAKKKTTAKKK